MEHTKPHDEKADAVAWLGMLGPPLIWIFNFEVIYAGVLSACEAKHNVVLMICSLGTLALIAGCAVLSRREIKSDNQARHFMAQVGLMSAALFALVTIAQTIAMFIMDPCLT
ncbi:MAG TPA: hypothetical protein VGC85_02115 [Chthoniobacterales bacterium]|jgi:peptidoglycan/LPS O-acetylase OafA/YrhL